MYIGLFHALSLLHVRTHDGMSVGVASIATAYIVAELASKSLSPLALSKCRARALRVHTQLFASQKTYMGLREDETDAGVFTLRPYCRTQPSQLIADCCSFYNEQAALYR